MLNAALSIQAAAASIEQNCKESPVIRGFFAFYG
jgi:hypothetical protein